MKQLFPIVIAAGLAAAGCGGGDEPRHAAAGNKAAPAAVQALTVAPVDWPSVYEAVGTVRARTAAVISSKVMGYVREVKVQAGDRVRAGQPLVVLDSRDLEAGFRQAEAARNEARSAIAEVENAVSAARAQLELAQVTFGRMRDLFEKRSISNQEFDEASAKLKVAQAGYQMAQAKREQLASKIAQAEAGYKAAEVTRSYAEIAAPFAGVVTSKTVDQGSLAAPGAPLFTIEREGGYRLEVAAEESKLASIRPGEQASVALDALDRTLSGRVSEIVPAIDAAARAFTVKIDLPSLPQVRSGLFGRARFELGRRKVLAVASAAVVERGQLVSVLVAEEGTARTRLVTLGERRDGQVEVLSGLNPGDKVIWPIPAGVSDGSAVEVRP
jgi:RND family efflux transporter MFP subunit